STPSPYDMSFDGDTVWVLYAESTCSNLGKPFLIAYSLTTGQEVTRYPISADTRGLVRPGSQSAMQLVGDELIVSYNGFDSSSTPGTLCWVTEMFAINKTTGSSRAIAGPGPTTGSPGPCTDPPDTDGLANAGVFTDIRQITSDGAALYTVGYSTNNNR